jgi:hypothetical protein
MQPDRSPGTQRLCFGGRTRRSLIHPTSRDSVKWIPAARVLRIWRTSEPTPIAAVGVPGGVGERLGGLARGSWREVPGGVLWVMCVVAPIESPVTALGAAPPTDFGRVAPAVCDRVMPMVLPDD